MYYFFKIIALVSLAIFSSTAALAQKWRPLSETNERFYWIDDESISLDGAEAKIWIKYEFKVPNQIVLYEQMNLIIDCRSNNWDLLYGVTGYRLSEIATITDNLRKPRRWEPIPPGSIVDFARKKVCAAR